MNTTEPTSIRNRLLAALPTEILADLVPRLHRVELSLRTVLMPRNEPIDTVYFLESGWISALVAVGSEVIEVGLIGREGVVGLPLLFGTDRSVIEAMVQAPSIALALDVNTFRRVMVEHAVLRDLLLRYSFAFNTQQAMIAGCNTRHSLEKRLTRWLLMSHDRAEGNEFPMTHELLSMMLGVRRSGVTVAAGGLREAGLISYEQGRVRILDRTGLERGACGCYDVVRREFHRVLGSSATI